MFDNLRAAFREAVDNFNRELNRDQVPDAVDRLLQGMKKEAAEARLQLRELEDGLTQAREQARREAAEEETCRRRKEMAQEIGDEETVRVATRYCERHRARREVLEEKALALEKEIGIRREEMEEMLESIKEAQARRDVLAADAGRTQARESLGAADPLFQELDRMADKMEDSSRRQDATSEILRDLRRPDLGIDLDAPSRPDEAEVDARLAELKRRMGRDSS
jgi:hypothetical protein